MTSDASQKTAQQLFVDGLRQFGAAANSADRQRSAKARAQLAKLRRGFAGDRYVSEALAVVYAYNPPQGEEELWLLIGALFATHPRDQRGFGSLGQSYGQLLQENGGRAGAAERRFAQLVAVEGIALRHYLRQAVQLLASFDVPLDYYRLLMDLRVLLADASGIKAAEMRQRIRLEWLKDFHRARATTSRPGSGLDAVSEAEQITSEAAEEDLLDV